MIEEKFKDLEADLFLLPEMFTTGFYMKAQEVADEEELALTWMKNFAKTKNAAIGGSVSVKDNDKFYNRFYFVKPDGTYHQYDKRHLFSYTGEDKVYTAGMERVVVEYLGFRFLLQVCFNCYTSKVMFLYELFYRLYVPKRLVLPMCFVFTL